MIPNGPTSVYNGPAYILQMQLTMCFLCLLYFQFYMCKTVFISVICLYVCETVSCCSGLFARRLKKKAFSEWVTMWWEARKEWALSIRADLHYRSVDV